MHATYSIAFAILCSAVRCDAMQYILWVILIGLNWYLWGWTEYACTERGAKITSKKHSDDKTCDDYERMPCNSMHNFANLQLGLHCNNFQDCTQKIDSCDYLLRAFFIQSSEKSEFQFKCVDLWFTTSSRIYWWQFAFLLKFLRVLQKNKPSQILFLDGPYRSVCNKEKTNMISDWSVLFGFGLVFVWSIHAVKTCQIHVSFSFILLFCRAICHWWSHINKYVFLWNHQNEIFDFVIGSIRQNNSLQKSSFWLTKAFWISSVGVSRIAAFSKSIIPWKLSSGNRVAKIVSTAFISFPISSLEMLIPYVDLPRSSNCNWFKYLEISFTTHAPIDLLSYSASAFNILIICT